MTIYRGSRYSKSTGYTTPTEDGGVTVILHNRDEIKVSSKDIQHYRVRQGQRLDQISYEIFGEVQYKDAILDANPQYPSELLIKSGDIINIPSLDSLLGVIRDA